MLLRTTRRKKGNLDGSGGAVVAECQAPPTPKQEGLGSIPEVVITSCHGRSSVLGLTDKIVPTNNIIWSFIGEKMKESTGLCDHKRNFDGNRRSSYIVGVTLYLIIFLKRTCTLL